MLKCLCFLTGRGLSPARAVPVQVVPGLSECTVRLQLGEPEPSAGTVRLEVKGLKGSGLSAGAVCLEVERPEGPGLLMGAVRLRLRRPILAGLWKFEKNWYHFVFVSNVMKNAT